MNIEEAKCELTKLVSNNQGTFNFEWDINAGKVTLTDVIKDKCYYITFGLRAIDDSIYIDFLFDGFAINFFDLPNFYTSGSYEVIGFINWLNNFSLIGKAA